jgi:porphobilinogen deaminase
MHAVSQGALGVECRQDDDLIIKMLNRLSDEDTVLRCIAERAFLTTLNGGCSAPIGVNSRITENGIELEGVVSSLDGEFRNYAKFETSFDLIDWSCPVSLNQKELESKISDNNNEIVVETKQPHYTYIVARNVDSKKLFKAEFCGIHLGHMLLSEGADRLIEESRLQVKQSS